MTEAEWWGATGAESVADWLFFDATAADRKLRLFSVACCKSVRHHIRNPGLLSVLDMAEAFADGRIDAAALATAVHVEWQRHHGTWRDPHTRVSSEHEERVFNAETAYLYAALLTPDRDREIYMWGDTPYAPEVAALTALVAHPDRTHPPFPFPVRLLHDIFGPLPFRDIRAAPDWLTSNVVALAQGIYDDKAFDRLPILADALEDAGCADADILTHCRAAGWEHVRGCWVVDLLLGRPWREG